MATSRILIGLEIIGVVSSPGVGFKFAARRFALKHYLGVLYTNVEASPSISEVLCSIDGALSNICFSDIDRKRVPIHELTRKINLRIPLYDKCLLILDNCNLTPGQLRYFIRFLHNFNKSIGIVFRLNLNYYNKLTRSEKKWSDLYNGLLNLDYSIGK